MYKYAVIVAGGSGKRMKTKTPKQFLEINGLPILMHTLLKFHEEDPSVALILVIPVAHFTTWEILKKRYNFALPITLVEGGTSRFLSVKNALAIVKEDCLVAIHDGVRPLVHLDTIRKGWEIAHSKGAAVAKVPLKDSIRAIGFLSGTSKAVDRSDYCLVQTPQTFQSTLIKKAYEVEEDKFFTDDASVLEYDGKSVSLYDGTYDNIKITTTEDLIIAKALMQPSDQ